MARLRKQAPKRILDQLVECPNCKTLQRKLIWDRGVTYRTCNECKLGMAIAGPKAEPVRDWRDS